MDWNSYFYYDGDSGQLIWKPRPVWMSKTLRAHGAWNSNYAGKVAGHLQGVGAGSAKYVRVHNKMYRCHRIIWEMHYGPIPDGMIVDHADRDYSNNRLSNLRLATQSQNGMNRGSASNNKLGLKGVSWVPDKRKFKAVISKDGVITQLGYHKTKGQAALAYAKGSLMIHGKFSPFYKKATCDANVE